MQIGLHIALESCRPWKSCISRLRGVICSKCSAYGTLVHVCMLECRLHAKRHYWVALCYPEIDSCYGRPWPAVYILFVQITHQIHVLTEPLCRAQAILYALPNNERGTKYRGLTYGARQNCPWICRATYNARQTRLRIYLTVSITVVQSIETPKTTPKHPKHLKLLPNPNHCRVYSRYHIMCDFLGHAWPFRGGRGPWVWYWHCAGIHTGIGLDDRQLFLKANLLLARCSSLMFSEKTSLGSLILQLNLGRFIA